MSGRRGGRPVDLRFESFPDEIAVTGLWVEFQDFDLVIVEERAEAMQQLSDNMDVAHRRGLGIHLPRSFARVGLSGEAERGAVGQWLPVSSPLSFWWIWALGRFRPMISTSLPRWAYLVSIASRAATEEASQMCVSDRSMTTLPGSVA